jgi:hypothetical protein
LHFGDSKVNGTLPTELGGLSSLEFLKISFVDIGGPLPTELGQLDKLLELELAWTNLTGTLPTEWRFLSNLQSLLLISNAEITGTIPSEYGLLTSLKVITIWGTALSGTVGPEVCALEFETFTADCVQLHCACCTLCRLGHATANSTNWDESSTANRDGQN